MNEDKLSGLRILVVEDNYLIAMDLRSILTSMGCTVLGPVATRREGVGLAESTDLDGAILDINIIGGDSSEIAHALAKRHCPFVFLTGYGDATHFTGIISSGVRIRKPMTAAVIREVLLSEIVGANKVGTSEVGS